MPFAAFEEAQPAVDAPPTKAQTKVVPFEDAKSAPAPTVQPGLHWMDAWTEISNKTMKLVETGLAARQQDLKHPIDDAKSLVKSLGQGAVDLTTTAASGLAGIASFMQGDSFEKGMDKAQAVAAQGVKNVSAYLPAASLLQHIMKINFAPTTPEADKAMGDLVGAIPSALQTPGDATFAATVGTPYEKLGIKIAAAEQGLAAVVALKPEVAGKVFKPLADQLRGIKTKGGATMDTAFDEFAATHPDKASDVANHINLVDPKTAKKLHAKIQKYVDASEDELNEIGRKSHDAAIAELEGRLPSTQELIRSGAVDDRAGLTGSGVRAGTEPLRRFESKPDQPVDKSIPFGRTASGARAGIEPLRKLGTPKPDRAVEAPKRRDGLGTPLNEGPTLEQTGAGMRNSVRQTYQALEEGPPPLITVKEGPRGSVFGEPLPRREPTEPPPAKAQPGRANPQVRNGRGSQGEPIESPIVYFHMGIPITMKNLEAAFEFSRDLVGKIPVVAVASGKLGGYVTDAVNNLSPEARGLEAKQSGAIAAHRMAELAHKDSAYRAKSDQRRVFWNYRVKEAGAFVSKFESGGKFIDPVLEKAKLAYLEWGRQIHAQDKQITGLKYEPKDNYLYHVFEDGDGVTTWAAAKYGKKFGDPGFIKDRAYETYDAAVKAGFKPKYTNPEDIMLARQHASDLAASRALIMKDLEENGLAVNAKSVKAAPEGFDVVSRRSPNGDVFYLHTKANTIFRNMWDSGSLWQMQGIGGDTFKGMMAMKNKMARMELSLSLFHPLHVMTIDNMTGLARSAKEMLGGKKSPIAFLADAVKAGTFLPTLAETGRTVKGALGNSPTGGSRLLKVLQGRIPASELTAYDAQSLRLMLEGGVTAGMERHLRDSSMAQMKDAWQRGSMAAAWHLPFAIGNLFSSAVFDHWIPSLKLASYMKDVQTSMKLNPELVSKPLDRMTELRRIGKSVDNRYGEMAYNTLFWKPWVKDLAVLNTLSLGWQMGFMREYGGGALDLGRTLLEDGSFKGKVKAGMLDRPLFVAAYTTSSLLLGGLMTYAFTGQSPKELIDYIYPKTGGNDPKTGKPNRGSTMFYAKEFYGIYKRSQQDGLLSALGETAASKSSGIIGATAEFAKGVNHFGQETRDQNSPWYKGLVQQVKSSLEDLEPISLKTVGLKFWKAPAADSAKAFAGIGKAPRYITQTKTEGAVQEAFDKYVAPKQTPYDKVMMSKDLTMIQKSYDAGNMSQYQQLLDKATDEHDLKHNDVRKLRDRVEGRMKGSAQTYMFSRLPMEQQKQILDDAQPNEREELLKHANKKLRHSYEPPESTK